MPDPLDLFPRLRDDGRRLQQHTDLGQAAVEGDDRVRLRAPPFARESVQSFDAVLGVPAVAAHVPFADSACGARHRIRPADETDHEVAPGYAAIRRRFEHPSEILVAEYQHIRAGWRLAVLGANDLDVRAAQTDRQRLDQDRAVAGRRFGKVAYGQRVFHVGSYRQRTHPYLHELAPDG